GSVVLRIAPVGQTSLQSVQLSWQKPIEKFITGVQRPSRPPSLKVDGCSTLVGQTRMHWSHLMQRSRNSLSSTEPGGRIALAEKPRRLTAAERRRNGNIKTPATPAKNQRRGRTSGGSRTVASTFESGFSGFTGRPAM